MLKPNQDAVKVIKATKSCVTLAQLEVANTMRQAWIIKHQVSPLASRNEDDAFDNMVENMARVWRDTNRAVFKENKRLRELLADATI